MRLLVESYGDVRVFTDRPYGYRRYHVEWKDGIHQVYSGLWYSKARVLELVEAQLNDRT